MRIPELPCLVLALVQKTTTVTGLRNEYLNTTTRTTSLADAVSLLPKFDSQRYVQTSLGEALATWVNQISTVIEIQGLGSEHGEGPFPVAIRVPLIGIGEWDRNNAEERVSLDRLFAIDRGDELVQFVEQRRGMKSCRQGSEVKVSNFPLWQELSVRKYGARVPMPWGLLTESVGAKQGPLRVDGRFNDGPDRHGPGAVAQALKSAPTSCNVELVRWPTKVTRQTYFGPSSYEKAISLVRPMNIGENASRYVSSGRASRCAYLFFRRAFRFAQADDGSLVPTVSMSPGEAPIMPDGNLRTTNWASGKAMAEALVPLELTAELAARHAQVLGIRCVGVNANPWVHPGRKRQRERKRKRKRRLWARKGGNQGSDHAGQSPEPMSEGQLESVAAALAKGAQRALESGPMAGATSQHKEAVTFDLDVGREMGTLGNAVQISHAAHAPLLITEAGTQYTDVVLAWRAQRRLPSVVLHPACGDGSVPCNSTRLVQSRTHCHPADPGAGTQARCDKCLFSRAFCIYVSS